MATCRPCGPNLFMTRIQGRPFLKEIGRSLTLDVTKKSKRTGPGGDLLLLLLLLHAKHSFKRFDD